MGRLGLRYPWSKWRKHLALLTDPELVAHLPETAELDEGSLHDYLRRFPSVYVKPSRGGGGRGVIRLERAGPFVRLQMGTDHFRIPLPAVYRFVRRRIGSQHYIVQQGIHLICMENRPMDFRTLLLKPGEEWQYMGVMGKKAVKMQIVTNHCRGGSSIQFREALEGAKGLTEEEACELEKQLESLSLRIAETLNRKFPLVSELGLDIGIDEELRLWLIEANTRPQYHLFTDHPDGTLYKRIDGIIRRIRKPIRRKNRRSG